VVSRIKYERADMKKIYSVFFLPEQIFLSSRAVYLLVFDLTKELDQPCEWNKVRNPEATSQTFSLSDLDLFDALKLKLEIPQIKSKN
jgi:hypothetical protein